ncbi:hypothetical protein V8C43DRAFT_282911 [Trichoderma afarasin]
MASIGYYRHELIIIPLFGHGNIFISCSLMQCKRKLLHSLMSFPTTPSLSISLVQACASYSSPTNAPMSHFSSSPRSTVSFTRQYRYRYSCILLLGHLRSIHHNLIHMSVASLSLAFYPEEVTRFIGQAGL